MSLSDNQLRLCDTEATINQTEILGSKSSYTSLDVGSQARSQPSLRGGGGGGQQRVCEGP